MTTNQPTESVSGRERKKCEWIPCGEKGKHLEFNGRGGLIYVCTPHRRLLKKQKEVDNNY